MRNRIISALSDIVLVVEARQKSGTSITVDTALEQGREVLAIPGRVTDRLSDGCNHLISQGAGVAISVEDVLDRLWTISGEKHRTVREEDLSDPEIIRNTDILEDGVKEMTLKDEIMDILDIIPVSASYIMEELYKKGKEISIPALLSELMDLTGSGRVAQNGAYYRKVS